jgi:hypothetical protein
MADKMTLGLFYRQALHIVTANIIPPVPHIHIVTANIIPPVPHIHIVTANIIPPVLHIHILFLQNQSYIRFICYNSVTTQNL